MIRDFTPSLLSSVSRFFCLSLLFSVTDHISRNKFICSFFTFIIVLKAILSSARAKGILASLISNAVCSAPLRDWKEQRDYVLLSGCLKQKRIRFLRVLRNFSEKFCGSSVSIPETIVTMHYSKLEANFYNL